MFEAEDMAFSESLKEVFILSSGIYQDRLTELEIF